LVDEPQPVLDRLGLRAGRVLAADLGKDIELPRQLLDVACLLVVGQVHRAVRDFDGAAAPRMAVGPEVVEGVSGEKLFEQGPAEEELDVELPERRELVGDLTGHQRRPPAELDVVDEVGCALQIVPEEPPGQPVVDDRGEAGPPGLRGPLRQAEGAGDQGAPPRSLSRARPATKRLAGVRRVQATTATVTARSTGTTTRMSNGRTRAAGTSPVTARAASGAARISRPCSSNGCAR